MQTQNRFIDDIARLFSNAAGAAQGLREEVEVLVRGQAELWAADLDLITREEFEAVRSMAAAARAEADALAQRVARLEAALAEAGKPGVRSTEPSAGQAASGSGSAQSASSAPIPGAGEASPAPDLPEAAGMGPEPAV